MRSVCLILPLLLFFTACAQHANNKKPVATSEAHQGFGLISSMDTSWTAKVNKSDSEWKKLLTPEQYHILREAGTERTYSSKLLDEHGKGVFFCAACNNPLFSSSAKFESGTGWPSFWMPISNNSVYKSTDTSYGMTRDEITCKKCGGHLGHVFEDGPDPTGLRYCMNGAGMTFKKAK